MRKIILLSIVLLTGIYFYSFAEGQDAQQSDIQKPEMQQEGPRGERPDMMSGMMGGHRMGMKGGMMMGMHPTVVATSDGGIVVLTGKTLAKYDASLNLVKEVELKGGPKPMDKKMDGMEMKKPPMLPQDEPMDKTESTIQEPKSEPFAVPSPTISDAKEQQ